MKQWIPVAFSPKIRYFRSFSSKGKKHRCSLPLHMCGRVLPCFFGNFCMDKYSVDSDEAMKRWSEAMKRGDEALNASLLQFLSIVKRFIASSLRFLLSVKCFIAVNFYRKRLFNASSPLLFKRNSSLNASSLLLFKLTLPTSAQNGCKPFYTENFQQV
jgi:hypothetical protein